jgi:ligand-binding SRPBCC domain-containing protein
MAVKISDHGQGFLLIAGCWLPRRRQGLFPFFADAANLQRITPASLQFHIETPLPVEMRQGTLIDYRLRLRGVPVRWRSVISAWDPPYRFVDEQRRGPYRWWRHEHLFIDEGNHTLILDRVEYGVPGGRLVNRLLVAPELTRIFAFRRQKICELLGSSEDVESGPGRASKTSRSVAAASGGNSGSRGSAA